MNRDKTAGKIRLVDPTKERLQARARTILHYACNAVEAHKGMVAGGVVITWDRTGNTFASTLPGGPIGSDALAVHAFSILTAMNAD